MVQEWWGVDHCIKDIASRIAAGGYFAVAADLYSRQGHKVTKDPNVADELMGNLKQEDGIQDLKDRERDRKWTRRRNPKKSRTLGLIDTHLPRCARLRTSP